MNYVPTVGPAVNQQSFQNMFSRVDIREEDLSLLSSEDTIEDQAMSELSPEESILGESMNYSPAIGTTYDVNSQKRYDDITDMDKDNPADDSMLTSGSEEDDTNNIPAGVIDYYAESALPATKRNKLPDSEFGLPRTRQYPLNDEAHVKQAIRMFGHCKLPKDRKILAENIFKAMKKFKLDVKIGKDNPLYQYLEKTIQEASEVDFVKHQVFGFQKPMEKRTKRDVVKEHLLINGNFYNNLFYSADFKKSVAALKEFEFLRYFYPDMKGLTFHQRLKCTLGGLACDSEIYKILDIKSPYDMDFNKKSYVNTTGGKISEKMAEEFYTYIDTNYDADRNWFKAGKPDYDHIYYCLRMYSLMSKILLDPNFSHPTDTINIDDYRVMYEWKQHVQYHYDLCKEAATIQYPMDEAQYLFDLGWNFAENPEDSVSITGNIAAFCVQMSCADQLVASMNESGGEIVTKEEMSAYLVKDLGMPEDMYLVPDKMLYPIINKTSIRMAMDIVGKVEPEDLQEYVKNLNKKYKEFGCTFSISVDHPYAKYADQEIIDHMAMVLMEGETAIDDEGTSAGTIDPIDQAPWNIRNDITGTVGRNLLDNKDMGPTDKKIPSPDYTRDEAFI